MRKKVDPYIYVPDLFVDLIEFIFVEKTTFLFQDLKINVDSLKFAILRCQVFVCYICSQFIHMYVHTFTPLCGTMNINSCSARIVTRHQHICNLLQHAVTQCNTLQDSEDAMLIDQA